MSVPYLAASLPTLSMDATPSVTPEAFAEECARVLDPTQAGAVAALVAGEPCGHPFVRAWRDRDTQIRNAIARKRAARRGLDSAPQRPADGCDMRVAQAVEAAFELPDPLARERAIDKVRWESLDELQGSQPISFEAILAYAVRLQIAWRWARRDAAAGQAFLDGLAKQDASGAAGA